MKSVRLFLPLLVVLTAGPAFGQVLLVDFNTAAGSAPGATVFAAPTSGQTASLGSDVLTFDFTNFTDSTLIGNSGAFSSGTFSAAAEDYFFVRGTGGTGLLGTLTISGFTGSAYTFELASSVGSDGGRLANIQVNGVFADAGSDSAPFGEDYNAFASGFNGNGVPLTWNNVVPVDGIVTITLQTPPGDPPGSAADYVGFLNGLQITVVPEPSSAALALAGLTGLWFRRRSQRLSSRLRRSLIEQ